MKLEARLTGEAAALARPHAAMLERLPASFHASILIELEKWPTLFAAEHAYQRALLQHLGSLPPAGRERLFAAVSRVEADAGVDGIATRSPAAFQDEAQGLLRKRRLLTRWRQDVDAVFQAVQPALDATLHPPDGPRRLVVQIYARDIAVKVEQLWSRFGDGGARFPLTLDGARGSDAFLRGLFGGRPDSAPTLIDAAGTAADATPLDAWIVESGDALHARTEAASAEGGEASTPATSTGLSYQRLRGYRDDLTKALYEKIQAGVESPQAFAAYARSLRITPRPGALRHAPEVVQAFVRDLFLTGNGTLFVNNTFVEWAAVQAIRRAQPRLLVTRYGVRDKMKPFSSLLLFSQPRASDQIPEIEDPVGSFVDVEQLSHYVWLNAEKSPAYRQRTLHLLLAEGVDQMLAIRSGGGPDVGPGGEAGAGVGSARGAATPPAASLADVSATMAEWLGLPRPHRQGRPIEALLA
jgi:hypothetical protein